MQRSEIQEQIETLLAEREPEVEVLIAELRGSQIELYIDHPDGVTLELCEQVSRSLEQLREKYTLMVSSPGVERPLTKAHHFERFVGHTAKVRTTEAHEGRKSFTGELVGATEDEVTIASDDGLVTIPYSEIHRSNLVKA